MTLTRETFDTRKSSLELPRTSSEPSGSLAGDVQSSYRLWVWVLLIVVATIFAHGQGLACGYIWDDDAYVEQNKTLRTWQGLWLIWSSPESTPQYYPLVHTTFWIEYHLWGLWPVGYHATNIFLHAISSVLIGRLLVRLQVPGAWLIALLFAVHPLHVESVAWITERKNVLSGLFYFLAATPLLECLGVLRNEGTLYRGQISTESSQELFWKNWLLALMLFLAALLSKTVTCTLPAAALLVAWGVRGRLTWRDVKITAPFFVLGISMGILTAYLEVTHVGATFEYVPLSFWDRLVLAGRIPWFYAWQIVWPQTLIFIYPKWSIDASQPVQWLYPVATLGVLLGTLLFRKQLGRGTFVGIAYFIGTLFPALGFFNVYPMRFSYVADHFAYLASLGIIALAGAGLTLAWQAVARRFQWPSVVPLLGMGLIVTLLAFISRSQTEIYKDVWTLWNATVQANPNATVAQANLGKLLLQRGDIQNALVHIEEAYRQDPILDTNLLNWMTAKIQLQQFSDVRDKFDELNQRLDPHAEFHRLMAMMFLGLNEPSRAEKTFAEGVARFPEDTSLAGDYGAFLIRQGKFSEAETQLRKATAIEPLNGQAWSDLGICLMQMNRPGEALEAFQMATQKSPSMAEGWKNLAQWYLQHGQPGRSLETMRLAHQKLPLELSIVEEYAWQLTHGELPAEQDSALARLIVNQALAAPGVGSQLKNGGLPTLLRLAQVFLASGDTIAARQLVDRYLKLLPENDPQRLTVMELQKKLMQ